jgi:uncharacterized protein YbjT (DUF2867 family)
MYAITGITGKVGGALADALLEAGCRFALSFAMEPRARTGGRVVARSP